MSKFKIGDKVVGKLYNGDVHRYLIPNAVYTVTGVTPNFIDIEGEPSEYCLERIKQGFASDKDWKQSWKVDWFELYVKESMVDTAEHIREEILRINTLIEKSKKDIEEAEKKRESLVEQLREKGFLLCEKEGACRCAPTLSTEDVHVGDKLILTRFSCNSVIPQGSVVFVELVYKSDPPLLLCYLLNGKRDWVKLEDVKRA